MNEHSLAIVRRAIGTDALDVVAVPVIRADGTCLSFPIDHQLIRQTGDGIRLRVEHLLRKENLAQTLVDFLGGNHFPVNICEVFTPRIFDDRLNALFQERQGKQ